jgi:RHS repeat-associated protein
LTYYNDDYATWDFNRFGGIDYNAESNTYHAPFRQYTSTAGRWFSPDPYSGSYDLSNPQSLNRYAYVMNNPLSFLDSSGLALQFSCTTTDTGFFTNEGAGVNSTTDCTFWGDGTGDPLIYLPTSGRGPTTLPLHPNNNPSPWKKFGKALVDCAKGSAGTAGAGAGLVAAGSNVVSTAGKFAGSTPGTSIASQFFRSVFPQAIDATWAPTLMNGAATSGTVGGVIGRWVPIVGEGLLIYSGVKYMNCVADNGDNFW